jgi:hypothetical protein
LEEEVTGDSPKLLPELKILPDQFSSIFEDPPGLPLRRAIDHQIHLKPDTKTINIRPYRFSYFQKMEIEKITKELLDKALIQPSTSSFSSPVLLVKKKDGSWRLCVDYRRLNDATKKKQIPYSLGG